MARAIDADELQELCNRRIRDTWNSRTAPVSWAAAYADFKDDIDSIPTLTPPNEPLTLEKLRGMDGEPVWIVDVGPHKWYGPGWAIVDRDNCLVRTVKNWNAVFFESYGERWLAYRRPPEVQS